MKVWKNTSTLDEYDKGLIFTEDKAKAASGDKGKTVKPSDDKTKTSPSDKGKVTSK